MPLAAGMPPVAALATDKVQGFAGTTVAAVTYARRGLVSLRPMKLAAGLTLAGAFLGALTVRQIDTAVLSLAVSVVLIAVAAYFLFAPRLGDYPRAARLPIAVFAPPIGFALGYYDGLLGPGTSSFLSVCFVVLFGLGITRALAHTKLLNAASNLGALVPFVAAGDVVWPAALSMAAGQLAGGWFGARTGLRCGARLIR
ncbi:MAG TPA: TSUP family transporter, partial [Devosiaceae bacterium]|nr:TSUP family transporter [Devosiaceae bacterium]